MTISRILILIVILYWTVINLIGLIIMGVDKRKAIRNAYRIPEATLFCIALLGGALGTTLGMRAFRHKTKHWYFVIGMPLIFLAQAALIIFFSIKLL